MEVKLPPMLEGFVQEQVEAGCYDSPEQVVTAALVRLMTADETDPLPLDELRREIMKGVEQTDRGESVPFDVEAIKAEGRRLLAERRGA